MKRISKEPSLQQQLREMCNCNIDTSPCAAELECRACFNAADLLDECERVMSNAIKYHQPIVYRPMEELLAKLRAQERG